MMKKDGIFAKTVEYRFPQTSEFYSSGNEVVLLLPVVASETFTALHETIVESVELSRLEVAALHDVITACSDSLNVSRFFQTRISGKGD